MGGNNMETKTDSLDELIRKIKSNEILLPDFQRNFAWKAEADQRGIVASVLAQMPIGSILLLRGDANEYAYKIMGSKDRRNNVELGLEDSKEVLALLDGQQRMTVLSNVFSNLIFETGASRVEYGLKRRFFLALPKIFNSDSDMYSFGIEKLQFPKWSGGEPEFLSTEILDNIVIKQFTQKDDVFYNPYMQQKRNYNFTECTTTCTQGEFYLVPLYMLTETQEQPKYAPYLNKILKGIVVQVIDDLVFYYNQLQTMEEKMDFITEIVEPNYRMNYELGITCAEDLQEVLKDQGDQWINDLLNYLKSCLSKIQLQEIVVDKANRSRAINIYENLNRGGISLGTFELIMARVASKSRENYYDRLVRNIRNKNKYYENTFPHYVSSHVQEQLIRGDYIAAEQLKCVDEKDDIASVYIDVFLNVLSLMTYFPDYNVDGLNVEYIKKQRILEIEPEYLDSLCEPVCKAIDRALLFFQMRCGIKDIKQIHYNLMIVVVAYIFSNPRFYEDKKAHEVLEAWYWISIFSGYYNSDQNANTIKDIKNLIRGITTHEYRFLQERRKEVLHVKNFSSKDFWMMENVAETEMYPKEFLRDVVCQYYLSRTYKGLFDSTLSMDPFIFEGLQKHHIIPLGSTGSYSTVKESTEKLRKDKKNILNSPINFVYITANENSWISNKDVMDYQKDIKTKSSFHDLSLSGLNAIDVMQLNDDAKIRTILELRFEDLKSKLDSDLNILLN